MNTAISIGRNIGNDRFDLLHQLPISKCRPRAFEEGWFTRFAIFDRATLKVSDTAVIEKVPSARTATATSAFWAGGNLKGFLENPAFHRLLAEQALQFLYLVLKGSILRSRNDLFLRCGGGQCRFGGELAPIE